MLHWYAYSDFEHYPHTMRFASIPDLLQQLLALREEGTSSLGAVKERMADHSLGLAALAVAEYARRLAPLFAAYDSA